MFQDVTPKPKKVPTIRRKVFSYFHRFKYKYKSYFILINCIFYTNGLQIIYGGLPDEKKQEEEEILSRRTRGRKINYREEMASDSEEV